MFLRSVSSLCVGRLATLSKFIVRDASTVPLAAVTKTIDPFSSIKIGTKCQVSIRPYNIHECPDSNFLRVSLRAISDTGTGNHSGEVHQFKPLIEIDGLNVTIDTNFRSTEQCDAVECFIEVPVAANLCVNGERNVSIENSLCDTISVTSSNGSIATNSVRAKSLQLAASNGHIDCSGMTLAQRIDLRTNGDKSIRLGKIQGVTLSAVTESGSISTEACYSESSSFTTTTGALRLKNIHMNSEICLRDGGELHLTGFHGTLNLKSKSSALNLQLAEISGESSIEASEPKSLRVNISESVEESALITVNVGEVVLDETLRHLAEKIVNKRNLVTGNKANATTASLKIKSDGSLALGKLSWIDSFSVPSR